MPFQKLKLMAANNKLFNKSAKEKEELEKENRRRASQMTIDFMLFADSRNLSGGAKVFDRLGFAQTITSLSQLDTFIQYKTEQGNTIQRTQNEVLLNGIPLMASDGTKVKAPSPLPSSDSQSETQSERENDQKDDDWDSPLVDISPERPEDPSQGNNAFAVTASPLSIPGSTPARGASGGNEPLLPGFEDESPVKSVASTPGARCSSTSVYSSSSHNASMSSIAPTDDDLLVNLSDDITRPRSISGQLYDDNDFDPRSPSNNKAASRSLLGDARSGGKGKAPAAKVTVLEHDGKVMDACDEEDDGELVGFDMRPSPIKGGRWSRGSGLVCKTQRLLQDSPTKKFLPNAITQERAQLSTSASEAEWDDAQTGDGPQPRIRSWSIGAVPASLETVTNVISSSVPTARLSGDMAEKQRRAEQADRIRTARKSASGMTVDFLLFSSPDNLSHGASVLNETLDIEETIKSLSALKLGHVYKTEQGNELIRPTLEKALLNEIELKVKTPGE